MNFTKTVLALTVVFLFSCSADETTPQKMYLKEIKDPSCFTEQYEYEAGRLTSFKRLFGEHVSTDTKFSYDANLLKTVELREDDGRVIIIELSYGANGLPERELRTSKNEEAESRLVSDHYYDKNGNLILTRRSYSDPNFFTSETEFEWANGNIIRKHHFLINSQGNREFQFSEDLFFDNKKNYTNQDFAFIYTGLESEGVLSRNNLIRKDMPYRYNKKGYPSGYNYRIDLENYSVEMRYH